MLHVVLVEDSKLDAQLIASQLERAGHELALRRVETGAEFAEVLRAPKLDIILSDYNVPGFGGEEALAMAASARPATPFIFVSGALGEHGAVELLKRGATDYVLKDQLERLAPSVERALREASEKLERQRAEELLRERERTLSTLMRNLPGMAFRRSARRPFRLEYASDGCHALTGFEPEAFYEPAGLAWERVMHPDDVARVEAESERAFAAGLQLTTTYRIHTESGEQRWVWERSAAQGPQADDTVEGFVTDITQQRAAEAEVRRRIEFEHQLIGIVSHDLRNPLHSITLGAAALLKQEGLNGAGTRQVRRILASAERAARMIRDLLDFTQARLGGSIPVSRKRVALYQLIAQVVEEFEHSHPERRFEIEETTALEGDWDPDRIVQALTNLVGNAVAYSPAESTITIRARQVGADALVEVHNWGEPIAEERIATLFEPLVRGTSRVDMQSRSIGLGLFIVRSIVLAHHGRIEVHSTREHGTTFRVHLPAREPEEQPCPS